MKRTITEFGNLKVNIPTLDFSEYLEEACGITYHEYDMYYSGAQEDEMYEDYWDSYRNNPMNLICLYLFGQMSYNWDGFLNQEGAE